jgi:hypothetical protein
VQESVLRHSAHSARTPPGRVAPLLRHSAHPFRGGECGGVRPTAEPASAHGKPQRPSTGAAMASKAPTPAQAAERSGKAGKRLRQAPAGRARGSTGQQGTYAGSGDRAGS